ncbi:MAG: spore photoproduct lyase [Clostridiales bacterium]|nr:spore photoproduct lyase [Clostridiales bacterium]
MHEPKRVYYEEAALEYELGKILRQKYAHLEWIPIENHNNIPELRQNPNSEFAKMKQAIVVAVRKTHKFTENHKTSDFLVPYTSSGCSAACLYCYLVCNYNKCAFLRLFVNREQMLSKIIKTAEKGGRDLTFEIGSNSDLILENEITENLNWTIENFGKTKKGFLTFPTKFDMVDPLLSLRHNCRIKIRMSVNPEEIIKNIEYGTSHLTNRIEAVNKLRNAGYPVGLLIAPVVMLPNWKEQYSDLLLKLRECLSPEAKHHLPVEVIFMTYSYVHRMINNEAFPKAVELYDKDRMTGRGMGKYCYKPGLKEDGEQFLREEISKVLPEVKIEYIV